jgi:tetratricopeptide (TPR) repeat protein
MAGLGWTDYEDGRFAEARGWFERVLESDPHNPYALTGLGVTMTRRGEYLEAQECYRSSLQKRFHPPALWHWFRLATLLGNAQQLGWFLHRALETGGFEQWICNELRAWEERVVVLMQHLRTGEDPWPYVNGLAAQLPRCYHA